MADQTKVPDLDVRQAPADQEALREAILDGTLSLSEAADTWPGDDRHATVLRAAVDMLHEWGYPTGSTPDRPATLDAPAGDVDAAVDRARDAVANREAGRTAEPERSQQLARWQADDAAQTSDRGLDLDGGR